MRLLRLRTVLAATDLTSASDEALATARRLVEAAGAKLHVVHVTPETAEPAPGETPLRDPAAADVVRQSGMTLDMQQVHILGGNPATAIAALASRIQADLIVLGHRRAGETRHRGSPVGSTAYAVITTAAVPCLVVSRPLDLPLQRALVATDFSEAARGALLVALSWSSALRAPASAHSEPALVALHVDAAGADGTRDRSDADALTGELAALRRSAGGWAGVQVQGVTRAGADPATCIAEYALEDGMELVVMGTHAPQADGSTDLGSVSDAVVRKLDKPVLLVPPAVWHNYARDLDAA